MAHNFKNKNIGVGITGSYCTYKKVFEELRRLADTQANLFTIFSFLCYTYNKMSGVAPARQSVY